MWVMKLGNPTMATGVVPVNRPVTMSPPPREGTLTRSAGFLLPSMHGDLHGNGKRAVTQCARLGFGKLRELIERADAKRSAHHQHLGVNEGVGDGIEVLRRIKGNRFVRKLVQRQRFIG